MNSLSQTIEATCPDCGERFSATGWLIVDTVERPDLLKIIEQGKLHQLTCPKCGFTGLIDSPLLLYRSTATPVLIFSPARQTTQEQDQEQANGLLGYLREQLGDAWEEQWLEQEMAGVPRDVLPIFLTEGLEAAAKQMQVQATAELERLQREDTEVTRSWMKKSGAYQKTHHFWRCYRILSRRRPGPIRSTLSSSIRSCCLIRQMPYWTG